MSSVITRTSALDEATLNRPRNCTTATYAAVAPRLDGASRAELLAQRASVRAKVEHPFLYIKQRFGYATTRYRGLAKNEQRLALVLGFTNLLIPEPQLD